MGLRIFALFKSQGRSKDPQNVIRRTFYRNFVARNPRGMQQFSRGFQKKYCLHNSTSLRQKRMIIRFITSVTYTYKSFVYWPLLQEHSTVIYNKVTIITSEKFLLYCTLVIFVWTIISYQLPKIKGMKVKPCNGEIETTNRHVFTSQ